MTPVETFAAYGAPALIIIFGYALVWWARLSPALYNKIVAFGAGLLHNHKPAPDKRV